MDTTEIKQIILDHLIAEYVEIANSNRNHQSYCHFPFEECTCKDKKSIQNDTLLISTGYLDSFSMIVVAAFLELTFSIKIPDSSVIPGNFESIDKMTDLVQSLQK